MWRHIFIVCMDDGKRDRQTNRHRHRQTDRQTDRTDRQIDIQTNKQTDRHTDRQRDRQTCRQTDRQTNRQTEVLTGTGVYVHCLGHSLIQYFLLMSQHFVIVQVIQHYKTRFCTFNHEADYFNS